MLDKLRMNRYITKVDEKATTIEPYRQMFGNKSLGKAFFDNSSDCSRHYTMGSFAAWKAGHSRTILGSRRRAGVNRRN